MFPVIISPPSTVEEHRAAKLTEIISGSNACAAAVKGRYSALEIDSWAIQQAQAETVLSGGTLAPDDLLTVLAAANGVSVEAFAARVMQNVKQAEALTKWVVATQQGYEARLKAIMADDTLDDDAKVAAIQGIVVDFTLPDMGPEGASAPIAADPEA